MATGSNRKAGDKTAVSMPVVIAVIAILIVFLGGLAWHYLSSNGGGAPARSLTSQEKADQDWLQQMAHEKNGNFEQLSPEDQRRLIALYGAKAPFTFRMAASHPSGGQ